ncbi:MAG TPA: glycoside hydrolase family 44 protein [Planctomycetota bacterium]|nr:glycoside hydrolase family 44 protein [Planctomycetota bacterium]
MRRVTMFGALLLASVAFAKEQENPLILQVDGSRRMPISPYVYGSNFPGWEKSGWKTPLTRAGGNRLTAYNWETNASNAGSDWQHQNDALMGTTDVPGEAMRKAVATAHEHGAAIVMTVPIIGHVAADKNGGGDVNKTPDYLNKRFVVSLPTKHGPFADPPDVTDGRVYQDEFVAWLEKKFSQSSRPPIFYCMDNEPELWASTHARIHPEKVRFDEIVRLNTEYAAAVKHVAPRALVFGFVSYGWHGLTTLQDAPDRNNRDFSDFFLQEMSAAEKKAGRRLIDVFDFHWYPEARGGKRRITDDDASPEVAAARIQSPRSLWDPSYKESSWVANAAGAIRLLPRLREKIDKYYPGTKLAMTEYYYGGGDHISGAIAQADVLGILGRENAFAAALWHLGRSNDRFINAAFAMYRNYDGQEGAFGDTGLGVTGGDPARASLYASIDAQRRTVLVGINKTDAPLPLRVEVKDVPKFKSIAVYRLTAAEPRPVPQEDQASKDPAAISLELPPLSVSTFVLKP